ncbi:WXG100 family type VII secretion target [Actinoplanes sp. NPDC051343]|uniref:WXG100 family type VII secretion target n=1 Tax=Actinoplanes sp. NPDC051343 TaxID=3363906 RepID=UPI0037B44BF4
MDGFNVNTAVQDDSAARLHLILHNLENALNNVNNAAKNYVADNKGFNVTVYEQAHMRWQQGLAQMNDALSGHQVALTRVATNYRDGDQTAARMIPNA